MTHVSSRGRKDDFAGIMDWGALILSTCALLGITFLVHILDHSGYISIERPSTACYGLLAALVLAAQWYMAVTMGAYIEQWDGKMRLASVALAAVLALGLALFAGSDAVASLSDNTADRLSVAIILALVGWSLLAAYLGRRR